MKEEIKNKNKVIPEICSREYTPCVKAKRLISPTETLGDDGVCAAEIPNSTRGRHYIKAFTLIELLVVVLIIGILSAVALPQYQKAVTTSKTTQGVIMLKSVYQAALEYQLANGTWPTSFADLSISIPWTGTTKWYTGTNITDGISDKEWALQISNATELNGVAIGLISGKYKGGGFIMWSNYPDGNMPTNTIVCVEKIAEIENSGDFCQKIMQSQNVFITGVIMRYYKMP